MFKKLIFSFALVIMLFSFNNDVHADESDKTNEVETTNIPVSESDNLISSYINLDAKSSEILNTTYLKSELMELDSSLMRELIEDLIAIEKPTDSDAKIMLNTLQAMNNASDKSLKGSGYAFENLNDFDTMKKQFEESNYSKEVINKGSIEIKDSIDKLKESEKVHTNFKYAYLAIGCVFIVLIISIIIFLRNNEF